jgi:lipopolysaccharide/colanic/teichoic acid biosynthesis glycosyltransferase
MAERTAGVPSARRPDYQSTPPVDRRPSGGLVVPLVSRLAGDRTRRVLSVVAAAALLVITLPLWVVIAIAIKLTSAGPIFYTQTRVGIDRRSRPPRPGTPERSRDLGGRPFKILKFRTMRVDAEHGVGAVWAQPNDPRVTPIGRMLRDYRLDELPQLINVLQGDMNIVGPRPERPDIVSGLRDHIPHYLSRQRVLPGITGHAQVNLEYDSSVDDVRRKIEFDIEYVGQASVWQDIKIMLKTIPVVLFRRGSR